MKVLFLSVTTGYGHNMSAKAVMEYLEKRGCQVKILDVFAQLSENFSKALNRSFLLSSKYLRKPYSGVYRFIEMKNEPSPKISVNRLTNALMSKKLESYLEIENPDVIICTHVFAALMITQISTDARTYGVITDYTVHPLWEDTILDYYLLGSPLLCNQAIKKGIGKGQILTTGIPIREKFAIEKTKKEMRDKLGFEDKYTILMMGGSSGSANIAKYISEIDSLDREFQIITVCARNEKMKHKIDKMKTNKTIYNFGFIDNIDEIMSASDSIITKPGGLTIAESLAKGLKIIISKPFPGQEDRNEEFLLNHGLAMRITPTFPLDECVFQLLEREDILNRKSTALELAKPYATRDFGEFILNETKV